jgi:hypothetical protein
MSPCSGKSIEHVMLLSLQGVFGFLSICYNRHILYIFCISDDSYFRFSLYLCTKFEKSGRNVTITLKFL